MAVYRKLNMKNDQRQAALRNLVSSLLWHGRIETTEARAKEARRIAEKLITLAVREYANDLKVVKKVADGDAKVKKEFTNDSPSKLAARRRRKRKASLTTRSARVKSTILSWRRCSANTALSTTSALRI